MEKRSATRPKPARARTLAVIAAASLGLGACGGGHNTRECGDDGPPCPTAPPPPPAPVPVLTQDLVLLPTPSSLVFGDFNGDGVEDFATPCGEGAPRPAELDVCAIDGKTFAGMWRAGPLGDHATLELIHVEPVGPHLVVSDATGRLHILGSATGKEVRAARLPGRPKAMCVPDGTPARVWVEGDTWSGLLDPAAATTTLESGAAPACRCEGAEGLAFAPGCAELVGAPRTLDGVADARFAGEPAPIFALAKVQDRGVPVATLMRFDPKDRDAPPTWSHPVAPGDPLTVPNPPVAMLDASGTLIVSMHGPTHAPHLIAFDPATGEERWDKPIWTLSDVRVSSGRVYVLRFTRVEVRAAETGAVLGGVGVRDAGDPPLAIIPRIELPAGEASLISAPPPASPGASTPTRSGP